MSSLEPYLIIVDVHGVAISLYSRWTHISVLSLEAYIVVILVLLLKPFLGVIGSSYLGGVLGAICRCHNYISAVVPSLRVAVSSHHGVVCRSYLGGVAGAIHQCRL